MYSPTNTAPVFKNPMVRSMMQFHQQPMNLATMMYRNMGKAAMGDNEARWTLAYQLGTAAAIGGMGGMPLDLPKLASIASMPLGGPSPEDWADKEHRWLAENVGGELRQRVRQWLDGGDGAVRPKRWAQGGV